MCLCPNLFVFDNGMNNRWVSKTDESYVFDTLNGDQEYSYLSLGFTKANRSETGVNGWLLIE